DIYRLPCAPFAQFGCKLDPLRLSSREFGRRLPQTDIRQPHIIERFHLPADAGNMSEKFKCFFHSHVQHIIDRLSFILHFQCLSIISFSPAYFTWNIHVRQKMHLDLQDAIPGTGLTPASLYIETEPSFFVSSCFRIRSRCKKISDQIEHSCVCCRIRPWSPADRGLVDVDYLVHLFKPFDPPVLSRNRPCMV